MFRSSLAVGLSLLALMAVSEAEAKKVSVKAHTRSDGGYVPAHNRTAPNETRNDNWTTRGNSNPDTGKAGTLPRGVGSETYAALFGGSRSLNMQSGPCYGRRVGGVGDPDKGFCILN